MTWVETLLLLVSGASLASLRDAPDAPNARDARPKDFNLLRQLFPPNFHVLDYYPLARQV